MSQLAHPLASSAYPNALLPLGSPPKRHRSGLGRHISLLKCLLMVAAYPFAFVQRGPPGPPPFLSPASVLFNSSKIAPHLSSPPPEPRFYFT